MSAPNARSPKKRVVADDGLGRVESPDPEARRELTDVAMKLRQQFATHLGTSPNLVQVRRIWLRRFRVNVLRPVPKQSGGTHIFSIGQSYFVRTNARGEIVRTEPPLPEPRPSPSTN